MLVSLAHRVPGFLFVLFQLVEQTCRILDLGHALSWCVTILQGTIAVLSADSFAGALYRS